MMFALVLLMIPGVMLMLAMLAVAVGGICEASDSSLVNDEEENWKDWNEPIT